MDPEYRVTCRPSLIFVFFCIGVQAFMAYNGGATSATVHTIREEGNWGPAASGALGAMDKLGMTVASPIFGFFLQSWPAKTLLILGLFINAGSTLLFATLQNHLSMCTVKFFMGLTEGLQWVWAPLWIARWADKEHVSLWMTISGGVVAGVGSGLGFVIAGFGTANGFSYGFAFKVEGGALFVLWLGLLSVSRMGFSIKADIVREASAAVGDDLSHLGLEQPLETFSDVTQMSVSMLKGFKAKLVSKGTFRRAERHKTFKSQLQELWRNKIFCCSALALASFNFTTNGMQFSWIMTFTCLWGISYNVVASSFIGLIAAGGVFGVVAQSFVRLGGNTAAERERISKFVIKAYLISAIGALLAFLGVLLHMLSILSLWPSLIMVWTAMFIVASGLNSTSGLLMILCTKSVDDEQTRSLGTGIYQCLSNLLGLSFGPFLPQLVISMTETVFDLPPDLSDHSCDNSKALVAGFGALLLGPVIGCFFAWLGLRAARHDLRLDSNALLLK
mmetsp:Transcript_69361/g.130870  ORF Transcript_69361/g.130870 Transcript_69361/m.130870 type:complete len:504 (+) Transcript_69361:21-1532(+)